jgi:hypothetical protein
MEHVLRVGATAQDPKSHGQQNARVPVVESGNGVLVTGRDARHELPIRGRRRHRFQPVRIAGLREGAFKGKNYM